MSTHIDNSPNTKVLIADSFFSLLQTKPIDSITVKNIVDECRISRQTFYYHFKDIFSVVEFLYLRMIKRAKIECVKADDLVEIIMIILNMIDANRLFIKKLMHSKWVGDFQLFASDQIAELLESTCATKVGKYSGISHEDALFLFSFLTYGIIGYTTRVVMKDKHLDVDVLAEKVSRLATGNWNF